MTRNTSKIIVASMLAVGVLALCALPLAAQDQPRPIVSAATASGVTPALGELMKVPQPLQYGFHEAPPLRLIAKPNHGYSVDTVEQRGGAAPTSNYSIFANILGVGNGFPGYTVPDAPPDTNMAVGATQILQWVNVSYTICNKVALTCTDPILGNTLWAAGIPGTACANNNAGDILAQYDRVADRWFLSQNVFTSPYEVCIAISDTNSALGSWHVWQFPVPGSGFPDYPKIGIWPTGGVNNGYYQAVNNFGPGGSGFRGPQICAFDRAALLAGATSPTEICFQLTATEDSLLPGDLDSLIGPPNTSSGPQDEFYIGSVADVDASHLSLYQFHADFTTPSLSFVHGSPNTILQTVPTYSGSCSGSYGGACVPQLGTSDKLDSLGDRLMYRFAYWNDGGQTRVPPCATCAVPVHQHWYVNGDVESSTGQMGVRWYEFQAPTAGIVTLTSSTLTTYQAGTYVGVPADSTYRWMGSLTQDKKGNILLGYSQSSANTHPAIYVAGRVQSSVIDPLSTLEPELLIVQGNGSQPDTSNRWGDYSSMRIDLNDGMGGCTFWYTTEYYMVTQRFDWSTQIASVRFAPSFCQ